MSTEMTQNPDRMTENPEREISPRESGGPGPSALEFLGTLAGGLVHEIKNPLSTLSINLTLLKEDLAASGAAPGMLKRVNRIEAEVQRLDTLLEEFLRFSGIRHLDRLPHDMVRVVRELVEFLRPGFERDGVKLTADVEPAVVRVDIGLLKQALLNLLLNAKQSIQGGGRVEIRGRRDGSHLRLQIRDDGSGIQEDELERVFEVYYSASKQGSGLGLPIARRVAEEHGGTLELESTVGLGTTVTVSLPIDAHEEGEPCPD